MATNPQRTKQIRRAALEVLKPAHPYSVPEETLLSYLDDVARPPLSDTERAATLAWLKDGKFAVPSQGSLDPEAAEWVITELGRSLLASL
jgi:hypothetical protein